jgi:hypothetical protein
MKPKPNKDIPQKVRFMEVAKKLEADESEEAFDAALKRIAKAPLPEKKSKKREGGQQ